MKKNIVVIQEEISDCGVCCLLSLIRYYGSDASLEELRYNSKTTKEGVNAYDLIECAKNYGFDALGIKNDNISNLPCIAHVNINESVSHFIVIYKKEKDFLKVMDPSIGLKKITYDEFYKISSGIYIELYPKNKLMNVSRFNTFEKKLKKILLTKRYLLFKIIILNIIYIIFTLTLSLYIKTIDYKEYFLILSLIFLLINVFSYYILFLINKITISFTNLINSSQVYNFFLHIFRLPLKYLHMKDKNEIVKRVEEMEFINNLLIETIINVVISSMIIITIIIIECLILFHNIFPILILLIMSYSITILSIKRIKSLINNSVNSANIYKSTIIDYINGFNSIYHSNCNLEFVHLLNEKLSEYLNDMKNNDIFISKINTIKSCVSSSFILLSNLIIMFHIVNNNMDITYLVMINYLNTILSNTIDGLTNLIPGMYYYRSLSRKINEFYDLKENEENNDTISDYDIKISNLSYSYNIFNSPIKNYNLYIKSGDKILIKGKSGCGKSTLLKVISKELDKYDGSITIGNTNLNDISIYSLYNNLYYSSQNETIFVDTILNNITMHAEYDKDELNKVIDLLELNSILNKKPFGINTFLYGGGEELSGGERQLIILARALITNKNIIILDESLSEVNETKEIKIINNIIKNYKNNTIIYVSHKNNINYPLKVVHM